MKLIAGNWKMHGTTADLVEVRAVAERAAALTGRVEVALCLPATLIHRAAEAVPGFAIGGQDMHHADRGAHTGDLCAAMLHDAGASLVIVGHSERRDAYREADADVRAKAEAGLAAGLMVILCVGESLAEREAGRAVTTVSAQVDTSLPKGGVAPERLAVAYEPIWAIGTGRVAGSDDIAEMHAAIRTELARLLGKPAAAGIRLLYGGSVKPSNAAELMTIANVDGALVGGASLKAQDFLAIARACG